MAETKKEDVPAKPLTAEQHAFRLRLDVAGLLIQGMWRNVWTLKDVAEKTGWGTETVRRVMYADVNLTTEDIGRLASALNATITAAEFVRAKPEEAPEPSDERAGFEEWQPSGAGPWSGPRMELTPTR